MAEQPEVGSVDALIAGALAAPMSGWDFSWADGRVRTEPLSWSYEDLAAAHLAASTRVLDVDTGGGEVLAQLLRSGTRSSWSATATSVRGTPSGATASWWR